MEQLAIIGAGPGGASLLKTFLDVPGVKILGISDLDPHSPGMKLAKQFGIYTTRSFHDLLSKPGKKMVFDATGSSAVAQELAAAASPTTVVVDTELAKLIWEIVEAKEAVNRQLITESDSLLSFIEQGLAHIDTLNTEHGQALKQVISEIRDLSELTARSRALIQETEQIMAIVKNVATQTRILGINASIESARAGELGRGFEVVADSIHKLSASTLDSVNSVSGTMEHVRDALENISGSVRKVVQDVQDMEAKQAQLTKELRGALQEMVASAEKLAEMAGHVQTDA